MNIRILKKRIFDEALKASYVVAENEDSCEIYRRLGRSNAMLDVLKIIDELEELP